MNFMGIFLGSSSNNFKPGFCIDTPSLGQLAPITIQQQSKNYLIFYVRKFHNSNCLSLSDATNSPVFTTIPQSQKPNPNDEQVKYPNTKKENLSFNTFVLD
jgi:hypothetical protein